MQRIVHGILFEGDHIPNAWDVSIWESRGHREVSARQCIEWREIGEVPPHEDRSGGTRKDGLDPVADAELIEENHQRSLKKAAQRAQTACRRVIKAEGFDELLTITYRENQQDRALCKTHFKEWVRRMRRNLGGEFRYCASFESQDRGAMHVHVACHKLPKHAQHKGVKIEGWRLGTEVWRSIVGADNGLVFVGGKKRWSKGARRNLSAAKMASYVSKYIMKDYAEAPAGSNRYSASEGREKIQPQHIILVGADLADAIGAIFECRDGDVVVSHRVGVFRDSYWLCTEPGLQLHGPGGLGAARPATVH